MKKTVAKGKCDCQHHQDTGESARIMLKFIRQVSLAYVILGVGIIVLAIIFG